MERVGEHPIPAGPLAVRWLAYELPELRAGAEGAARVVLENAGTATWRSRRLDGVKLSNLVERQKTRSVSVVRSPRARERLPVSA